MGYYTSFSSPQGIPYIMRVEHELGKEGIVLFNWACPIKEKRLKRESMKASKSNEHITIIRYLLKYILIPYAM